MEGSVTKTESQELREKMDALKKDFAEIATRAKDQALKCTTDCVQEHPLASVGIAAGVGVGVGLLLGLLIGRKL